MSVRILGIAAALGLFAGPVSATIVNISGTQNGEQSWDYAQVGALISPVQLTFQPGTYRVIDAYNSSTGYQAGALYDAWNFEAGNPQAWVWHWKAFLDDGADGSTINAYNYDAHLLLDVDAANPQDTFRSEQIAADFGTATAPSLLTFATTTTVDFVVDDYDLRDNAGGVSLDIEPLSIAPPAVPEPASWTMMLTGFGLIGAVARRSKTAIGSAYSPPQR